MKKTLIKILGVLLTGFILYWGYLYIEHSKTQKNIGDVDKALKECYEWVKKDVKINRLGVPECFEQRNALIAIICPGVIVGEFRVGFGNERGIV